MCVCKERQIEKKKGGGEMRVQMAGVSERARASHAKDPWRSRTSGERRAERREREARMEVERTRERATWR